MTNMNTPKGHNDTVKRIRHSFTQIRAKATAMAAIVWKAATATFAVGKQRGSSIVRVIKDCPIAYKQIAFCGVGTVIVLSLAMRCHLINSSLLLPCVGVKKADNVRSVVRERRPSEAVTQ